MDIEKVKGIKFTMEQEIGKYFLQFSEETGLSISDVDIETVEKIGSKIPVEYVVNLEVKL